MSTDKYSTITQHQPLRVPETWTGQERRFVAQLEELLDDIYRRFGRLKLSDLGTGLQNTITTTQQTASGAEATANSAMLEVTAEKIVSKVTASTEWSGLKSRVETNETTISQEAGKIAAIVTSRSSDKTTGVGEVHNSSLDITAEGVDLKSTGYINIAAGGQLSISSGGKGNIDLREGGGTIAASKGDYSELTVGGKKMGTDCFLLSERTYVTFEKEQAPADLERPCLWINVLGGGGQAGKVAQTSSRTYPTSEWSLYESDTPRILNTPSEQLYSTGSGKNYDYTYTATFSVKNYYRTSQSWLTDISLTVYKKNVSPDAESVTFVFNPNRYIPALQTIQITVVTSSEDVNLFDGSDLFATFSCNSQFYSFHLVTSDAIQIHGKATTPVSSSQLKAENSVEIKYLT